MSPTARWGLAVLLVVAGAGVAGHYCLGCVVVAARRAFAGTGPGADTAFCLAGAGTGLPLAGVLTVLSGLLGTSNARACVRLAERPQTASNTAKLEKCFIASVWFDAENCIFINQHRTSRMHAGGGTHGMGE